MPDAFDTLGLSPSFDLNADALQRRLIELTAEHHPDRYTDPFEQAEAAERSAAINDAYRTLADPQRRAAVLLQRMGGATADDDKALPPDLLMEMMAVREEMEAAIASDDAETLSRLRLWAQQRKQTKLDAVGELFASYDSSNSDTAAFVSSVKLQLNALRYFQRMLEQMPG